MVAVTLVMLSACREKNADPRVLNLLDNPDWRVRRRAIQSISASQSEVSSEIYRAVVRSLRFDSLSISPGPPTIDTDAMRFSRCPGSTIAPVRGKRTSRFGR